MFFVKEDPKNATTLNKFIMKINDEIK